MAIKRYPLNTAAIDELLRDIEKLYGGLPEIARASAERATEHAAKDFDYFLSAATPGRQAVINTETRTKKHGKYGTVGTLTATGKTEETGFNILMAVEFGAGIAYNFGSGNPSFSDMRMGVGTWPGQTHAFDFDGWFYPTGEVDEKGKPIYRHTYGTPATMPMHRTIMDTKAQLPGFVAEEIKKWLT